MIPDNITLKVGNDKDAEATFVPTQTTWTTPGKAGLMNLAGTFTGWNLNDFQNYDWQDNTRNGKNEAFFNYMTKVETGEIIPECAELTKDLALSLKLKGIKDSSKCDWIFANSPAFEFSGNENLSNSYGVYHYLDFSNCSGLTGSQYFSVSFDHCKLPTIQCNGSENVKFSGHLDLSTCVGLTKEQIEKAAWSSGSGSFVGLKMTSAQFNEWRDILANSRYQGDISTVYVDGVATEIDGTMTSD